MKTVLVTGATSGFGLGLVKQLLKDGFKVVATGRNLMARKEIFALERELYQDRLIELNLDVALSFDRENLQAYFIGKPLDILINNAGFAIFGPAEECSEEKLRRQFEVNVFGLILTTQALLPNLRMSQGHIINFSSVFGFMGFPLASTYCASKFAVEGFSESLSYELKPYSVKVSLVEPGAYRTNFNSAAEWGMSAISESSVYSVQVKNYMNLRQKMSTRPNPQNPEEVVRGVMEIINSRNPKLSYTYGKDARFVGLMMKLTPRFLFHRVSRAFLNKAFTKAL